MKKVYLLLGLVLLGFGLYAQQKQPVRKAGTFSLPAGVTAKDYRPGVIVLKFKPGIASVAKIQSAATAVSKLSIPGVVVVSVTKKFADSPASSTTSVSANPATDLSRIYELKFSGDANIVTVINQLLQQGNLEYAEPDYIYHHFFVPNDPRYTNGSQAYLDVVKAPQAWDLIRDASSVVIGLVDSGTDLTHEDLAANIYVNTADPVNGIDDDHDGYIDNYKGWDLVGLSGTAIKEDNDVSVTSDTTEHGVHVSGIAGAISNNAKGVASISFNTKLLIVKCGADNSGSAIYRGYDGIKYAVDHGAMVINCSWGGSGGGAFGQDIVNYAISKGALIVAAAGNESTSQLTYPAAYAGVLAVSAVSNTDVRASYSNFGTYVGISAPGNSVLSTFPGSKYGTLSGTSMASPVVASAAALLKAYVPSLTMAQVGERLRATADNIDAKNTNYTGLLGKGRLNVYRALTEAPPSIRYQKITLADNGNGSLPAGDVVSIYLDLKDLLAPVNSVKIHLSSASAAVTVTDADQVISSITTGETKTMVGPFKVLVKAGITENTPVTFKLDYSANAGSYADGESFALTVNLDFLNVEVNKISTTFTSNGRIGYSLANAVNGLGFLYNNQNLLFEAGLIVASSPTVVSDNVRAAGSFSDEHFVKKVRAAKVPGTTAAFEARSEFDDTNSPTPLPVYVKHRQIAFATAPDDKYTIAEYEVVNRGTTTQNGVYIGLFTDWDVDAGTNNITKYDATNRLAYVYSTTGGTLYGGVKLLSSTAAPAYYPLSYSLTGDPTADNNFSAADKYLTLSSGIKSLSLGESSPTGLDVMFTSGYGPFSIPAGASVKVAFALIAGDNLTDLKASAAAAQARYNVINPPPTVSKFALSQNFPNPVSGNTTIEFALPRQGKVTLNLYNLVGKKVRTYLNESMSAGTHSFIANAIDLENGVYIYRMQYENEEQALKLLIAR